MNIRLLALLMAVAAASGLPVLLQADDTDIYTNHIVPPTSEPMVMFSIDNSSGLGATYAGCVNTGSGSTMCPAAKFFYDRCASCQALMPAANKPFRNYDAIRFALRIVMLESGGFKAGLMLSHDHEPSCIGVSALNICSNGGYIARGFKSVDHVVVPFTNPVVTTPGPNVTEFLSIVDSLPVEGGEPDHSYQGKELFFEFFRYLTGQNVYNGHNGYIDYGTNKVQNLNQDNPAIDWDASIEVPLLNQYISPLTTDLKCSKIFTVNFLLNPSRQDDDSDAAITSSAAGGMVGLSLSANDKEFKNVVGYLNDVDLARDVLPFGSVTPIEGKQNVTSYFFSPPTPLNSNPPKFDQASTSYANAGGTNRPLPFNDSPEDLLDNLRSVVDQILSVSTTFVSASVPVNVFNRSQTLDSVYLALFQADSSGKPFWPGNLKKLRLNALEVTCALDDTSCRAGYDIQLLDSQGTSAVASDGRIRNEALTYWTDGSVIAANPDKGVQAGRDGRHVDVGGAGQKIPGYLSGAPGLSNSDTGARQLYAYPGAGAALVPLTADLTTATSLLPALGASTAATGLQILKYIRGYDTFDADGDLNLSEIRPWMLGDPLHSRPLPINYGAINGHTQNNPAIYIAMGTNDGFLHFFRNTDTSAQPESGVEAWAFMPVESLAVQEKLALNNVTSLRLYGVDGASASYIKDVDRDGNIESADGDRVYLYVGQRRGGRGYYALDVTNPAQPAFLWRAKPTLAATLGTSLACLASLSAGTALSMNSPCAPNYSTLSCSGDFCELGYGFPQPKVGNIQYGVDSYGRPLTKPAVFFAGGYDTNKDYPDSVIPLLSDGLPSTGTLGTNDSVGNAIYVVDAETGALIWKAIKGSSTGPTSDVRVFTHAQLLDSIPSTLTIVDTDGNGTTDRIVVGDTGGNVWRADLGGDLDAVVNPTLSQITDDWKLTLVAKLGRHATANKLNDRRFFHEPDYVLSRDEGGPFDAIVLGSGDREDPMDYGRVRDAAGAETFTENGFYVIKDRRTGVYAASDTDPATVLTPAQLTDVSNNCLQNNSCSTAPDLSKGWRIQLTQKNGEKALSSPLTAAHRVYFTSYLPKDFDDTTSCAPSEGSGLFYAISLKNGTAVFNYNVSDGVGAGGAANTAADRFDLLTSSGIPSEAVYVNLATSGGAEAKCVLSADLQCRKVPGATRFRTFWRRVE